MSDTGYTSVEELPAIVDRLRATFAAGKTKPVSWRKDQLKHLAYLVKDNEKELCDAVKADLGRSHNESYIVEISGLMNEVVGAVSHVEKWAKPEKVNADLQYKLLSPKIYKEPKGVALIIGTWNYPVSLTLTPLVGAIAAGCPALIKCSEVAKNTGRLLARLIPQYLDTDAYAVVLGEVDVITRLLEEPWGHIFYTGNSKIARVIAGAASMTLTPVTLELGGKSPVIIDPELQELDLPAKRILWAKRLNAGQTCIAPDFVMVKADQQEALLASLKKEHNRIFSSEKPSEDGMPNISSTQHFKRLSSVLEQSTGTPVLGKVAEQDKNTLGLTIVKDVTFSDALMKDELFGPILPIVPVPSIEEGIKELQNKTPLGLYIFSKRQSFVDWVRNNTQSGAVVQNDLLFQYSVDALPFGGVGESGQGSYHGKRSFDVFTHERAFLHIPFWAEFLFAVRYYPYTDGNAGMFRKLTRSVKFSRPGKPASIFGVGGIGRSALKWSLFILALALSYDRLKGVAELATKYRLVKVSA